MVKLPKASVPSIIVSIIFFLFSFSLMSRTFQYDSYTSTMRMSSKVWSDFGAHIPLIRSFSYGANWDRLTHGRPIESPLFPGEPIRYHFGFYALVGALEKAGLKLDWALNIPSALGFFLLLMSIWYLAKKLFGDMRVGILSVLFFICNGSLSFLYFFQQHPLSLHTVLDITTNSRFPVFGPWDGGFISAFWNLNIYTNQRHLGLSYGLALVILIVLLHTHHQSAKHNVTIGGSIGILFVLLLFFNYPVAVIVGVFFLWFFLVLPEKREQIIIALLLSFPAAVLLSRYAQPASQIIFDPGYLAPRPFTIITILHFWVENIGLHIVLIPLGLLFAPKKVQKLFAVPLVFLFLLPNFFRFSPDMINNHKFFNFVFLLGNMCTASAVISLFKKARRKLFIAIPAVFLFILFLTLSGIIDFFAVQNDYYTVLKDVRTDETATWVYDNTPKDTTVLNSTWFMHPATLAGRAIFSGYPYFTWSYGYDKDAREKVLTAIFSETDKNKACLMLEEHDIGFVELNKNPEGYISVPNTLWETSFVPAFIATDQTVTLYDVQKSCKG